MKHTRDLTSPNLTTETQARRLLRVVASVSAARLHSQCYFWVRKRLLPAMDTLMSSTHQQEDLYVLSECWDNLCGVHIMNGAYGAALLAGHTALTLAADNWVAARNYVVLCRSLGRYLEAQRVYSMLLKNAPDVVDAREILSEEDRATPAYDLQCWHTGVADALADGQLEEADRLLRNKKSLLATQWRARRYGASGDVTRAQRAWEKLTAAPRLHLDPADWFYLPEAIWDDPAFWRLMLRIEPHLSAFSSIPIHVSLQTALIESGFSAMSAKEANHLMLEFHLARTLRDFQQMQTLCNGSPFWTDACRYAKLLTPSKVRIRGAGH